MKKPGKGMKALAGVAAAPVVYFGGTAVGDAVNIEPGWKRGAIGVALTVALSFIASSLKQTKAFATSVTVGGVVGAVALMFEPQLKSFMAERAVAPRAVAPPAQVAPSPAPPPALPPPPPPTPRPPTTEELIFGTAGELIGMFGKIFTGTGGAGMTYSDESMGAGASLGIYEAARN